MKKSIIPILSLFLLTSCVFDTPKTSRGFLKAEGKYIVAQNGEIMNLHGVNFGGWLHMEGWLDGGRFYYENPKDTSKPKWANHQAVLDLLRRRFSEEEVQSLLETYQLNYIVEQDFIDVKNLGMNLIRIPFYYTEILDINNEISEHAFDQLDFAVNMANKYDLYIILDLHGAPGGQSGGWETGGIYDSNKLWYDDECLLLTKKIWTALADHYKNEEHILGYDVINEPVTPEESELKEDIPNDAKVYTKLEMYDELYKTIREVDNNHAIILEAFFSNETLVKPSIYNWENVIYETHNYETSGGYDNSLNRQWDAAHWMSQSMIEKQEEWNVPYYQGEFNFWNNKEAWEYFLSTCKNNYIMTTMWTYKNTSYDSECWGLYHHHNKIGKNNYYEYDIDYQNGTYEEIEEKYSSFKSTNYTFNTFLADIYKEMLTTNNKKEIPTFFEKVDSYPTGINSQTIIDRIDDDPNNKWSSYSIIQEGNYVGISFGYDTRVSRIEVYNLVDKEYPKTTELYYYKNGQPIKLMELKTKTGINVFEFDEIKTSKIIIRAKENSSKYWTINEIKVLY